MDVVLEHDGQEITVDSESLRLPDGHKILNESDYVPKASLKDTHVTKREFQRRFDEWMPKDKAHEDADVVTKVLAEHKSTPDIDTLKANLAKAEIEPRDRQIASLRKRVIESEIIAAAKGVFADEFVESPEPGIPAYVVTALSGRLGIDPEHGVVALGPDGEPMHSTNASNVAPYMTARELITGLKETDRWKPYMKAEPSNSGGSGPPKGGGGPPRGTLKRGTMSEDQKIAYVKDHGLEAYKALPE